MLEHANLGGAGVVEQCLVVGEPIEQRASLGGAEQLLTLPFQDGVCLAPLLGGLRGVDGRSERDDLVNGVSMREEVLFERIERGDVFLGVGERGVKPHGVGSVWHVSSVSERHAARSTGSFGIECT